MGPGFHGLIPDGGDLGAGSLSDLPRKVTGLGDFTRAKSALPNSPCSHGRALASNLSEYKVDA